MTTPARRRKLFADAGATALHVVDLDGAFAGASRNGDGVRAAMAAFPAAGCRSAAASARRANAEAGSKPASGAW